MPAVAVIFDRTAPYGDEGRVVRDLLGQIGLSVPEKIYTTIQPGILTSNRHMLPDICALAFGTLIGARYNRALLEVTPFTMDDGTGGVVASHS